jgi:hypothetical protein
VWRWRGQTLALKVLMEFLHKKTIAFNAANKENSFPLKHFAVVIGLPFPAFPRRAGLLVSRTHLTSSFHARPSQSVW